MLNLISQWNSVRAVKKSCWPCYSVARMSKHDWLTHLAPKWTWILGISMLWKWARRLLLDFTVTFTSQRHLSQMSRLRARLEPAWQWRVQHACQPVNWLWKVYWNPCVQALPFIRFRKLWCWWLWAENKTSWEVLVGSWFPYHRLRLMGLLVCSFLQSASSRWGYSA